MATKILIIEDDPQITKILNLNLRISGFEIQHASSFNDAWEEISNNHYDLLLMDIGLPDGDGIELCKKVRECGNNIPIIFISARTDEATVVKGIKSGADDYLRKPFGMEELKVRINKFVNRIAPNMQTIRFGELTIDPAKRIVTIMGKLLTLGRKELDILALLARRTGDIVTRDAIIASIYEEADLYDRTIDSHMSHLRKKIREVAGSSLQISSVYGLGYRLEWRN